MPNTELPEPDLSLWGSITPSIARSFGVFPFSEKEDGTLVLAAVDSSSVDIGTLEFMIGRPVSIISFLEGNSPAAVDELVDRFYPVESNKGEFSNPAASELASFLYLCHEEESASREFVQQMEQDGWTGVVVTTLEDAKSAVQRRSFGKVLVSLSFGVARDQVSFALDRVSPGIVVEVAPNKDYKIKENDDFNTLVDRYELALAAGDGGVWEYDFRTRKTWFSRGLVELLGLGQSFQSGGLSVWKDRLIPEEDFSHVDSIFERSISSESGDFDVKHRLLTSEGNEAWVHSRGSIIRTRSNRGKVIKLAGNTTLLSQEEFMMRQAMDEIDGCFIFVKDRELRFRLVNQALAEAFGKKKEEIIGKKDSDLCTDDDEVVLFNNDDLSLLNSDTAARMAIGEEVLTDVSGRKRILTTIKRVLRMPNGNKWLLGVATDISDLKSLRTQLDSMLAIQHLQSGAFKEILNESSHIVWIAECSGRVVCCNDHYSRISSSYWKTLQSSNETEPSQFKDDHYFEAKLPTGEPLVLRGIPIWKGDSGMLGLLWIARICDENEHSSDTWVVSEIDEIVSGVIAFAQSDPELNSLKLER